MRTIAGVALALAACTSGGAGGDGDGSCDGAKCDGLADARPVDDGAVAAGCADEVGAMPDAWIRGGPDCGEEPEVQVHRYGASTFILRQSLCTSFEAPFLYLLFGEDQVLLEDTGAGGIDIVAAVDGVIEQVLAERGQDSIELLVINSHGHGDHVAGNDALEARPGTTVFGFTVDALQDAFGLEGWPDDRAEIDLGGRVVDLIPIPGHQDAHVALFDRRTGLLLTGDTLYPGRLYIDDFATYQVSMDRLLEFAHGESVCSVLGTHIEMSSTPGDDYEFGVTDHPDEHGLPLDVGHLEELEAAVDAMAGAPQIEAHDDFIVYPL